jgi:hypothetical protein
MEKPWSIIIGVLLSAAMFTLSGVVLYTSALYADYKTQEIDMDYQRYKSEAVQACLDTAYSQIDSTDAEDVYQVCLVDKGITP